MSRPLARFAALAVAAIIATGCAAQKAPTWTYPPGQPVAAAGPAGPAAGAASAAPAAGPSLGTLKVTAVDLGFQPSQLSVAQPGTYEMTLTNSGALEHNITFADGTSVTAKAGATASVNVNVPANGITFLCSVPGHAEAGMKGSITVSGATASASTTGGDHGGPAPVVDTQPDPNAPAYTLYDATAPKVLPGTEHDINLTIEEKLMTVAPGYVVNVWAFGGTVPGPVIRVHQGDTVRIHLINPATNKLAHSIDFHASQTAWNDQMTSINPGDSKVYTWHADYAGVWMYHCGTAPALMHIANGMYGMVIVEPKGGLPPVDSEFALVQSEWYLGAQGQPISLTKAAAGNPAPDYVAFNGVANQYKDNPLKVKTGGTVRVFVLDAGPNIGTSFHIVGTIFNTVVKEGVALLPSNAGGYGSQAMDLAPAQGGMVEFTTAEDGLYPVVDHAFTYVGRGAMGLVQAGDGDPFK